MKIEPLMDRIAYLRRDPLDIIHRIDDLHVRKGRFE